MTKFIFDYVAYMPNLAVRILMNTAGNSLSPLFLEAPLSPSYLFACTDFIWYSKCTGTFLFV